MSTLRPFTGELDPVPATPAAAAPTTPAAAPAGLRPFTGELDQPSASPAPAAAAAPVAQPVAAAPPPPTAAPVAAPPSSAVGEIGRQLGLTARAAANAVTALPAMASDAVTGVVNEGLDAAIGKGQGFRFQRAQKALNSVMTSAGVPEPANATERVVQDIATGMGSAGAGVAVGKVLSAAAGPLTQAAGLALQQAPGMQVASGAASGAASGTVREAGGGEGAQFAAGVAGALAPSVLPYAKTAGLNAAVRGGEEGRKKMVDNIQTFQEAADVMPTLGQASGRRGLQAAETGLSNVVGGSGVMVRKGQEQADAMANSVRALGDELAPGANGMEAGEAITRGVGKFKEQFKNRQGLLYAALDQHMPGDSRIAVDSTRAALASLNEDIAGAPALSKWFKNARIQGIEGGLLDDTGGAAAVLTRPGMKENVDKMRASLTEESQRAAAANERHVGNLRLQNDTAIERNKQWRQQQFADAEAAAARNAERQTLGMSNLEPVMTPKEIAALPDPNRVMTAKEMASLRPPNVVRSADEIEKEITDYLAGQVDNRLPYEALKKLRTLVGKEISDGGLAADVPRSKWTALYGALSDDLGVAAKASGPAAEQAWSRANQFTRAGIQRLEQLDEVVNKGAPEKVFKAVLTGTAEGGTTIRRVMRSLPQENRREVAAAVLQRMGRAKPGQQNELGDEFSSEVFLTNMAAMSPQARQALFGSSGMPGLEKRLNQLARLAATRREGSQVFANPSGTARQAGMFGWVGSLIGGIAAGNPLVIMTALGAPVIASGAARAMTSPKFVAERARRAQLSKGAAPAALEAIAREGADPEPKPMNRIQLERERRQAPGYADGGVVEPQGRFLAERARRQGLANGGEVLPVENIEPSSSLLPKAAESAISQAAPEPEEVAAPPLDPQLAAEAPSQSDLIEAKAHEAASSPLNDRPEPTEGQAKAGNYKKGHIRFQGLDIAIENPQGSTRRGKDKDGTPWESELQSHYGYVKGSKGNDGDHLDVFIGPDPDARRVYVIDQVDEDGSFDEHKCMLGFTSAEEAEAAYRANYPADWQGLGAMTELPMPAFKAWARSGKLREPLGDIEQAAAAELENVGAQEAAVT